MRPALSEAGLHCREAYRVVFPELLDGVLGGGRVIGHVQPGGVAVADGVALAVGVRVEF
jgi:hypothetical protein